jgi:hypothetical protein
MTVCESIHESVAIAPPPSHNVTTDLAWVRGGMKRDDLWYEVFTLMRGIHCAAQVTYMFKLKDIVKTQMYNKSGNF